MVYPWDALIAASRLGRRHAERYLVMIKNEWRAQEEGEKRG